VNRAAALNFVHVDHLNTPRLVADATGTTVWRWDQQEPFGDSVPDENPSGQGLFEFPLRFPGQYLDRETNVAYNWMRDYDPTIGRYVQSDPSGLIGGANTYLYVFAMVLVGTDRSGLITCTFSPSDFNPAGCTRISRNDKDVSLTEWRPDADIILSTIPVPLPRIEVCPAGPGTFPYIVRPCTGRTKEYDEIQTGFFDVKRLYRRDDLITVEIFKCPGPCGTSTDVTRTSTCTGTWTATELIQRGGFGTRIYHRTLP
jgi:RHS repeat-associated protein